MESLLFLQGLYNSLSVENLQPMQLKVIKFMIYRVSHQSSDTINSRTVLCKNETTNPITIYIHV